MYMYVYSGKEGGGAREGGRRKGEGGRGKGERGREGGRKGEGGEGGEGRSGDTSINRTPFSSQMPYLFTFPSAPEN